MAKPIYSEHMVTHSGIVYKPTDMTPDQIDIEDIAHSLSMQIRFNGHIKYPYSVAAHSVLLTQVVAKETTDPTTQLWALLHDAGEAYVSDIPTPIKRLTPEIAQVEDEILKVIAEKFQLPPQKPKLVGELDKIIAYAEADFLSPNTDFWANLHPKDYKYRYKAQWKEMNINQLIFKLSDKSYAKQQFLYYFNLLTNQRG